VVAAGAMVALGRLPLADILLAAIAASALGHGDGSRSGADRAIDDRCSPAVVAGACRKRVGELQTLAFTDRVARRIFLPFAEGEPPCRTKP